MEEWRDIPGFMGYKVSNKGRIWSERSNMSITLVMLNGFYVVGLHKDRRRYTKYVHRLVAQAFITPDIEGRQVKIVNGDHTNVGLSNLRVTDFRAAKPAKRGSKVMIKETGKVFDSVRECAMFLQGHPSGIYNVLNGPSFTYLGFHFQYVGD